MKLEDFVYAVLQKAFWELEHTHHFIVPEATRKTVIAKVQAQIADIIKEGSQNKPRTSAGK